MRACLCGITLHPIPQLLLAAVTEVVRVLLCSEHARGHSVSEATWLSMDLSVTKMCHNFSGTCGHQRHNLEN